MNWEAVGAVGEVGGAVAVVATLVYLAAQVRQSQQIARSESESHSSALWFQHCLQPAIHPGVARIVEVGLSDPGQLDAEDVRRFRWWIMHFYFLAEDTWRKHKSGLLSREAWEGYERVITGMWNSALVAEFWEADPASEAYSLEFRAFMMTLREQSSDWSLSYQSGRLPREPST